MKKLIIKLFMFFLIFTLSMSCICLAANETMPISNSLDSRTQQADTNSKIFSDLFISDKTEYNLTTSVEGNVFSSSDFLNIGSDSQEIVISGSLFVIADTVNIKSNVIYSKTEKDSSLIERINSKSTISGNVFVIANNFILEPGCEIFGDLYICADNIQLSQNSIVHGNVFAKSNTFTLDSKINGDLYVSSEHFTMKYYGFVCRDLHITSENSLLEGLVNRNSFIDSDNIETTSTFINEGNLYIENSNNTTFSGTINGNANINSKKLILKSIDNANESIVCKIIGDLKYSSSEEINISDKIINGNISYTKYVNTSKKLLSNFFNFIVKVFTILIYIALTNLLIKISKYSFIDYLSNIKLSNLLVILAIGIGAFILIPIISILLLLSKLGIFLGFSLMLIYILLLQFAKAIFIIYVSTIINKKFAFNKYITIILITSILSAIGLIPYMGFVLLLISQFLGLGLLFKRTFSKQ